MSTALLRPGYLFEVSWEVCNKVGGIHTVIATKANTLEKQYSDHYIVIGPDVVKDNVEFAEDFTLLKLWKEQAIGEGLKVRIGRWNVAGKPIAILVDFSSFFAEKNEIFTDLWNRFSLDSLTGGHDYIEPALFGYATGKVIECFCRHHLGSNDRIAAHFHEWITGVGVLYLKQNVPQAATVFTTHATVLGRSVAGSGVSFYNTFDSIAPHKAAIDFNVVSKHSLEKTAAGNADCFTTVSEITARECIRFLDKAPDIITHNGFDISILPDEASFNRKKSEARKKILQVAEGLFNQQMPDDTLLIIKSSRYEYKNKGLDVFIDSLAALKDNAALGKTVLGIMFVPAHQSGIRKEVEERIGNPVFSDPKSNEFLTHDLYDSDHDAILKEISRVKLHNLTNDKVKIIFVPTYLDGNDGIFNMKYYDLLIGFDLAIFPSYYEPWGYTPLESIAYHIPTIATNLSGFGAIVAEKFTGNKSGIYIVNRTDNNYPDVIKEISEIIFEFTLKTEEETRGANTDAYNISLNFLWENLIVNYEKAYNLALRKSAKRKSFFQDGLQVKPIALTKIFTNPDAAHGGDVTAYVLPKKIAALEKLAANLWWGWNHEAEGLFEYIDAELWEGYGHNPLLLLRHLSTQKIEALAHDKVFLKALDEVEKKFDKYISVPVAPQPHIAYFSMEYGLCSFIKLYSGGLGILAGDYIKEASDQGINITAVGLLYRNGYFRQEFSAFGDQIAEPDTQNFNNLPLERITTDGGAPLTINVLLPGRIVLAQVWKLTVGRVGLYLLDTDLAENNEEDRHITSELYNGNHETRLKQEIILGIGGIRALNAMGINPAVYHCNEGHAAFISLERIHNLIKKDNRTFDEAVDIVSATTLFTTHTAVPAANDMFSEELLSKYLADKEQFSNIAWTNFIGLGRMDPNDPNGHFSMAYFAAKLSREINAVSKIHEKVARELLSPLWKDNRGAEHVIGSVTNGVHYGTWTSRLWQQFYADKLGVTSENICESANWNKINKISPKEIWDVHTGLKRRLTKAIKRNAGQNARSGNSSNRSLYEVSNFNENSLVIGFARRIVQYKRSGLLFTSIERLARIISNQERPVVFVFSGKAHPADDASIHIINQLLYASANPTLKNSIVFLEDYNMDIARALMQGVDVWLNTPVRHTEASGTSGMKAALNGALNFSVLDGWWAEAYNGNNGWALSEEPITEDAEQQDKMDAETIYDTLENEIIPLFFDRDEEQIPLKWIEKMKASLTSIAPRFNMQRVLKEYYKAYYEKMYNRAKR